MQNAWVMPSPYPPAALRVTGTLNAHPAGRMGVQLLSPVREEREGTGHISWDAAGRMRGETNGCGRA